jgi:hypothetical protein
VDNLQYDLKGLVDVWRKNSTGVRCVYENAHHSLLACRLLLLKVILRGGKFTMAGKNTAAFGIYPNRVALEEGLMVLREANFRPEDISVLYPDNEGTKDFGHEKATKAPEGASAGAGAGAVIGGTLGWLAGIGAITIPAVGPFIAAGPIVAALAGVGAGGVVGGITGSLIGLGIPEYEAKRYEGRIRTGGILISVHCDDSNWTDKAKTLLNETGAEDVSSTGEARADFAASDKPLPRRRVREDV